MTFDYAAMASTARRLLDKFGADRTYTHYEQGAYDPATGTSTETESNYTLKTVKVDYTAQERTLGAINTGDVKLLIEPGGDEPVNTDTVALSDGEYELVNVKQVRPADTVVLYIAQGRR